MPRRRALSRSIYLFGALIPGCQASVEASRSSTDAWQATRASVAAPIGAADTPPNSTPAAIAHPDSPPAAIAHSDSPPAPIAHPDSAGDGPRAVVGPLDVAAISGGALVVWSRHDGDTSDILLTRLDARGVEDGAPRLVRRTRGEVLDLAVRAAPDGVWLAWVAALSTASGPRGLVAAVAVAADLSATSSPLTLDRFARDDLSGGSRPLLRLLALDRRSAVVAAVGAAVPCRDINDEAEVCAGYHVHWVRGAGSSLSSREVARLGADGEGGTLGSLVDVGAGFLLDVWAWHGGATHADVFIARDAAAPATPQFRRVQCRPPYTRGFDGRSLVTLCAGDYALSGERCDDDLCERVHAVDLDDGLVTPQRAPNGPPVLARRRRCHDGRPVLQVAWKGGQLRLDPLRPGASLDLDDELGVWTGVYALKLDQRGAIARARCRGDRLVDVRDRSLPDRLDLEAPVAARLPVRASG